MKKGYYCRMGSTIIDSEGFEDTAYMGISTVCKDCFEIDASDDTFHILEIWESDMNGDINTCVFCKEESG